MVSLPFSRIARLLLVAALESLPAAPAQWT